MKSSKQSLGTLLSFATVLVMIGSVFVIPRLLTRFTKLPPIAPRAAGTNASLSLPAAAGFVPNSNVTVPLTLNTDGVAVVGVDIVVTFDRSFLTLVDVVPVAPGGTTLKTFVPCVKDASGNCPSGTFDKQTVINDANGNETGTRTITFGATTFDWATQTVTNPFVGLTNLATLTFLVKKEGETQVLFSYTPGSTTDSNIVPAPSVGSADILASVTNLTLTQTTPTPTTALTPTPQICATRQYGDLDGNGAEGACDGDVDIYDFNTLYSYFSKTDVCGSPASIADIYPQPQGDCQVNIFDFNQLYQWFGKTLP